MKRFCLAISVLLVLFTAKPLYSQNNNEDLIAYWTFDAVERNRTKDEASGKKDKVKGNFKLVEGVKGDALKCDGFTTAVVRDDAEIIRGPFSIEAWVAPQAYPWNWCAVVNQEYEHQRGFFFGIDAEGRVGFHAAVARQWRECISERKIPFMEWSHIASTYDPEQGITLYINGKKAGSLKVVGDLLHDFEMELLIARNHNLTIPTSLNRGGIKRMPASYSFDGIIDELKIIKKALTAEEIENSYNRLQPNSKPPLTWRKLPQIYTGNNEFGAYYTNLKYDEDWDALWKVDKYPDVVVTFPNQKYSMVFWRGTNYNLNLVTENGKWVGDQSAETWGNMGCSEHMSDKHNRYSHVRIIENNDARVVVHWRYALTDIAYEIANIDPVTTWGDWADEYYYIYPDGIAIRHFLVHGNKRDYSITEPALFSNPGEKPEDNIDLAAVTLANLKGQTSTHSYETWPVDRHGGFKGAIDEPVVCVLNLKSEIKPFYIYEEGARIGPYGGGIREIDYRYSKFHSRNHWPVSQVPCDGRFALAPDRVISSAITSPEPPRKKRAGDNALEGRFILGLTDKPVNELVRLAKFWLNPPRVEIKSNQYSHEGYNINERAYVLVNKNKSTSDLNAVIYAGSKSPLVNPFFIIKNWGTHNIKVMLDNKELVKDRDFTCSVRKTLYSKDLLVWFNLNTQSSVNLSVIPVPD